jgi:hypothetical protein
MSVADSKGGGATGPPGIGAEGDEDDGGAPVVPLEVAPVAELAALCAAAAAALGDGGASGGDPPGPAYGGAFSSRDIGEPVTAAYGGGGGSEGPRLAVVEDGAAVLPLPAAPPAPAARPR